MPLNIIFMGTPEFSIASLETINNSSHKIITVYTQPPKKNQEDKKLKPHQFTKRQKN